MGFDQVVVNPNPIPENTFNGLKFLGTQVPPSLNHSMSTASALSSAAATPQSSLVPVIEIATYSDTDVYECYIRGFESRIVMRRLKNDWINITQVFKLASFSKTKRTKILEKESTDIEHEKVQGGYGRFQGTWIPLKSAKELVHKYSIQDPVVNTLLNFIPDPNNLPPRRTKNSALKKSSPGAKITSPSSYKKTPKKKGNTNNSNVMNNNSSNMTSNMKKSKKFINNNPNSQMNPSPLQNLIFQTPQQSRINSGNATGSHINTGAVNDTNLHASMQNYENEKSGIQNNVSMISQLNSNNETQLPTSSYSATQKPLQFFTVPTNIQKHQNNLSDSISKKDIDIDTSNNSSIYNSNTHNDNKQYKQILEDKNGGRRNEKNAAPFLTFMPEGPHPGSFVVQEEHQENNSKSSHQSESMNDISSTSLTNNYDTYISQPDNKMGNNDQNSVNSWKVLSPDNDSQQPLTQQTINMDLLNEHRSQSAPIMYGNKNSLNGLSIQDASQNANTQFANNFQNSSNFKTLSVQEYKDLILQVLASEDSSEPSYRLPPQLYKPPKELDINFQVDEQGHTPLHWATAMANIPLIKLLLALNCNILSTNFRGFNCISKSIFYNNCYKAGCFSEILSLLKSCIITPDNNGRLPLHYLVELSVNKSKDPVVVNFYIANILQHLAEEDTTLLSMCLNYQDNSGNTVLHLAALNLNIELCQKLILLGSSLEVSNLDNDTPASLLNKFNSIAASQAFALDSEKPKEVNSSLLEAHGLLSGVGTTETITNPDHTKLNIINENDNENETDAATDDDKENKPTIEVTEDTKQKADVSQHLRTPNMTDIKGGNHSSFNLQDAASLNHIIEDYSALDSLVTSSVIRLNKSTPSRFLQASPMLYKKRPGDFLQSASPMKKIKDNISTINEVPLTPMRFNTPIPLDANEKFSHTINLSRKISDLSHSLESSITSQLRSIKNEIESTENMIKFLENKIETTTRSEKQILSSSHDGVKEYQNLDDFQTFVNNEQVTYSKLKNEIKELLEKSQKYILRKAAQEGALKWNNDSHDITSTEEKASASKELEQLKNKHKDSIKAICNTISEIHSSDKILKYRRLIGITFDDIDSNLDDIERDLKSIE